MGGHYTPPLKSADVKVVSIDGKNVTFSFEGDDASYFQVGLGYIASFVPFAPDGGSESGGGKG